MNILIISTSPRSGSFSLRFAQFLKKELEGLVSNAEVSIVDFEQFDIPVAGREGLKRSNLTDFQQKLIQSWEKAQLVFFCLPEYNWTTNGEVFILLEQLGVKSFAHLFEEKIFVMIGISSGRGGRMPALEVGNIIEKLISFLGKIALVSPKLFEAHEVGMNLNEFSESTGNPIFEREARSFLVYTLKFHKRWISGIPKAEVIEAKFT